MVRHRVIGKAVLRLHVEAQHMLLPDGTEVVTYASGPSTLMTVGTVLDDVSSAELLAFPDGFMVVEEESVAAREDQDPVVPQTPAPQEERRRGRPPHAAAR